MDVEFPGLCRYGLLHPGRSRACDKCRGAVVNMSFHVVFYVAIICRFDHSYFPMDQANYEKLKNDLVNLIIQKNKLSNKLSSLENSIYEKEYSYFSDSTLGNIVKGFDAFSKTSSNSLKKRIPFTDQDHIFSLSSYNYIKSLKASDEEEFEDSVELEKDEPRKRKREE